MKTKLTKLVIFTIYAFSVAAAARAQGPAKVTIADTLYQPNGQTVSGTLVIINPNPILSADGFVIPANTATKVTVTNGVFSVALVPNIGASPSGSFYTARYQVTAGFVTETWVVPSTPTTVNLYAVRVLWPQAPQIMFPIAQLTAPPNCQAQGGYPQITTSGWSCGPGNAGGGPNFGQSFTSSTMVTILGTSHNLTTKNLFVQCYDNASPANALEANWTVDPATFNVVVTFATAQTGSCIVNGSGPPRFASTFTNMATVIVPGATHGIPSADLRVTVYDSASGTRNVIEPGQVQINSATFDVTVSFLQSQSGRIVIQ